MIRRPALILSIATVATLGFAMPGRAQSGEIPPAEELIQATAAPVRATAGAAAEAVIHVRVLAGWHINANPAANENMIATVVSLARVPGVTPRATVYPAPKMVKLAFDEEPLKVWDGETTIRIPIAVAPNAPNGKHTLKGQVMFQACNDQICLAPTTVPFDVVVEILGGAAAGTTPPDTQSIAIAPPAPDTTTAETPAGLATRPPPGADTATGGWLHYFAVFLLGLALNLTPCVYPMLGVTVSIFGARRAAPPAQVFGMALLYVLGMALMYTVLGVSAALTGGLFGAFLQNPAVLIGIGVLMIALALSMFGLYELQPPPALLNRLGGSNTTSAAGVFLSGLVVGVFAAPCIGPPIVGLLALVGARADPWFGFTTFFTLAMGLGLPYLILGTFSSLLQTLPRSGEWMVWVKKVFGVVLLAVGAFYAMLALAPAYAFQVIPAALLVGGAYLGFVDRSAGRRLAFRRVQWLTGVLAIAAGVVFIVTTPRAGLAFRPYNDAEALGDLPRTRPLMIEFSANWCVPCHELERTTFADARVVAAARRFDAYHVDLTRYDSPAADELRRRFQIRGVPTVLFLDTSGREIRAARVEEFLPPERFLERMELAVSGGVPATTR